MSQNEKMGTVPDQYPDFSCVSHTHAHTHVRTHTHTHTHTQSTSIGISDSHKVRTSVFMKKNIRCDGYEVETGMLLVTRAHTT